MSSCPTPTAASSPRLSARRVPVYGCSTCPGIPTARSRATACWSRASHILPNPSPPKRLPGRSARSWRDRKSTRLNSSHQIISYPSFCLKKKHVLGFARPLVPDEVFELALIEAAPEVPAETQLLARVPDHFLCERPVPVQQPTAPNLPSA